MKKTNLPIALLLCGATALQAAKPAKPETFSDAKVAAPAVEQPTEESKFTWGGDVRLRSVYLDNIPYPNGGEARGGDNSFQRYRTRIWSEYQASEDLKVRARLVNEFRTYQNPDNNGWNPLDEVVIDNLYFDWKATPCWTLRVGRQDLIYGTGKLILDGTPEDGSRTIYFDAIKATYTGIEDTTIDFLGMYTRAKDPLAMHSEDRDVAGKSGGNKYSGVEAGGGIYLKNKSIEGLPLEAYYLVKLKEEEWGARAPGKACDDNNRHTVGARFMPKFSDTVDGNLEVAYQFGDEISAYMIDALVSKHFEGDLKPCLGLGWYHLSGDDPGTTKDEGWNPLWARWPQYSELYIYAFDRAGAGRWSNLSMPHIDFTFQPHEKVKTSLLLGYMFAPETDGVGGGHDRGFLATLKNEFTIKEGLFSDGDKLTGHVLLEAMDPGNYYARDQREHTALFGRVELNYSF